MYMYTYSLCHIVVILHYVNTLDEAQHHSTYVYM